MALDVMLLICGAHSSSSDIKMALYADQVEVSVSVQCLQWYRLINSLTFLSNNIKIQDVFSFVVSASSGIPTQVLPFTVTYTDAIGRLDPACAATAESALDQQIMSNSPGQTSVQFCTSEAIGLKAVGAKSTNHSITTSALSVSHSTYIFFLNDSVYSKLIIP